MDATQWIALADLDAAIVRKDGHIEFLSSSLARSFGYDESDITLAKWGHANDLRLLAVDGLPLWPRILEASQRCEFRARLSGKNQANRSVRLRVEPKVDGDALLVLVQEDVAASEGILHLPGGLCQEILNRTWVGIVVIDLRKIHYSNAAFAESLGFSIKELVGLELHELVDPDELKILQQTFRDSQRGDHVELNLYLRIRGGIGRRHVFMKARSVEYQGKKAMLGSALDITDLQRSEVALRDYARRLRLLSRQILEVQENERRHLARELHDEIGQQLTLIRLSVEQLGRKWPSGNPPSGIPDVVTAVTALTNDIRSLSLDLRPSMLDDLGLAPALRWYAGRTIGMSGVRLELHIAECFPRLGPDVETTFFRIAQEAITNALRHSGASCIGVSLEENADEVILRIADDGCGFEIGRAGQRASEGSSAGVLGMQERAGLIGADLTLASTLEFGTTVRLTYPKEREV